jgi:hypothetical protein
MDSKIGIEQSYALFGVDRTASIDEIKAIYRQKAKAIHPDLHPHDPHARDRFAVLNQAYKLLLTLSETGVEPVIDGNFYDVSIRTDTSVEPSLSPRDLQFKQETFIKIDKLIDRRDFAKAIMAIDLLVKVINSPDVAKKQSEVYFLYARSLIDTRRQLPLARNYLKISLKLDPNNQKRWEAVNREFNRIERIT